MWYKEENGYIIDISDTEKDGYVFTDEELYLRYDGAYFVLESEYNSKAYKELEEAYNERNVALSRIVDLKQMLNDTDYQAIKYAEGMISEEEYAPIKAQRQSWRDEINQLEEELK